MQNLTKADMLSMVDGACVLASGGGGPIDTSRRLIGQLPDDSSVSLVGVDEVDSDSLTAVVAFVGSPEAMSSLQSGDEVFRAFKLLKAQAADPNGIKYLVPVELGAISVTAPLLTAHAFDLRVVDADGAGRAVPELPQVTFPASGVSSDPSVIANADHDGDGVVMHVETAQGTGDIVDAIIGNSELFAEHAGLALWLMTKDQLTAGAKSLSSLSLCRDLARAISKATSHKAEAAVDFLRKNGRYSEILGTGEVIEVKQQTVGGFDVGSVVVKTQTGESIRIYNQNENLICYRSDQAAPLAVALDSICYLLDDGQPISNAEIKKRDHVSLISVKAVEGLAHLPTLLESFRDSLESIGFAGALTT